MSSKPNRPVHSTNVRWFVFAAMFVTSWMLYLHRYAFAFIKPMLVEEWNLDKTQLGLLDSTFSFCYTAFQFPLGIAADVVGVHWILPGLILTWSLGLALHAWAPSVGAMWYARATLGMGQSAVFACLNSAARTWFPQSIRTTLQGAVGVLAGRLGGLSSSLLFGLLLLGVWQLPWRTSVWILVAAGVVNGIVFALIYRNSPQRHPWVNQGEAQLLAGDAVASESQRQATRMSAREMLKRMSPRSIGNIVCLNVQTILSTFADNIYSNWIPLFLWEVHELKFKEMGIYSALPLLGGAIAGVVGGILNDACIAYTGNRRWSRRAVAMCGKGAAALLLFTALIWYENPYLFCGFLFFVKFFGDWSLTTTWGVVSDIGGRATASVFAFNNSVAGIGAIAAPTLYGLIAHHYGWRVVFVTAATTYVLCALSWLWIDCTVPVLTERQSKT